VSIMKVKKCREEDRKSEMSGIQEVGMGEIRSLSDADVRNKHSIDTKHQKETNGKNHR